MDETGFKKKSEDVLNIFILVRTLVSAARKTQPYDEC